MDYPFDEIVSSVAKLLEDPRNAIHQKFTCSNCGARQTMATPNKLFTKGTCEQCDAITDIQAQGCNYMLLISARVES